MDYRELPEEFLEKMKQFLGEEYPEYLASYEEEPRSGLRVNTGRLTPEQFLEMAQTADWNLKPVPWTKNGFYYQGERPSRHPWYYAGLYYLQEPSAMSPAAWLPIKPGDRVLDLCAAPGGKSTELAAKLAGTGVLFSNDISNSRAKALLKNLEMFGAGNICVTSEAGMKKVPIIMRLCSARFSTVPCRCLRRAGNWFIRPVPLTGARTRGRSSIFWRNIRRCRSCRRNRNMALREAVALRAV